MNSDMPLDYAVFQLSPKRSRCELVVSSSGNTEKLASGLVKPFVAHLRVAEEQVTVSADSIKLEVERQKNADTWFTKGTLERFVRFVSTPEILELANTFDAEMSQLESARRIYSQGTGDQISGAGGSGSGVTAAADATKKELLRAIDVRLLAVQQDLTTACARATAAGFNPYTVSDLQMFADRFGAQRLNEACSKFISLCERRPDLVVTWKAGGDDRGIRSSYGSDMSIDEEPTTPESLPLGSHHPPRHEHLSTRQGQEAAEDASQKHQRHPNLAPSKPSSFPLRQSRESSLEPEEPSKQRDGGVEEEKKQESGIDPPDQAQSIAASQPSRRLSVQDRINLFENKQKENSGGKPVVGKSTEIRRLSSDVSSSAAAAAVERAVLRRWSGASDMSLDLSGEKKDIESPLCTPSSSVSHSKSEDKKDYVNSGQPDFRSLPASVDDSVGSGREEAVGARQLTASSAKSEEFSGGEKSNSCLGASDDVRKDQTLGKSRSRSFLNKADDNSLNNQANTELKFRSLASGKAEEGGLDSQLKFKGPEKMDELVRTQVTGQDNGASQPQSGHFDGKRSDRRSAVNPHQSGKDEFSNPKQEDGINNLSVSQTHLRAPRRSVADSALREGGSGSRIQETFGAQNRGIEGNASSSRPWFEASVATEEIQHKDLTSAEKLSGSKDSGLQRMRFEKQVTPFVQIKTTQGRKDDNVPVYGINKTLYSSVVETENQEGFSSFSTPPPEHAQRIRQSKGNQGLNDELKMKANELEKLFAEHKLRGPGDQSNPTRRSRAVDRESEPPAKSSRKTSDIAAAHLPDDGPLTESAESSKNMVKFNDVPAKMVSGHYSDTVKNFSELKVSDGSRGKFYERYMQKRNAKLKEDWSSNREEKEAKLKAMQDSLERSRAEMKSKFSGSADKQDSTFSARRRAERLKSFNTRSIMRREQQQLDFGQSDDDVDTSDFSEQKYHGEDGPFNETSLTDGLSKSKQSKKNLPTKSLSSSTPRTSAVPVPRSANRASNSSGRRKMQSENPLAQSVPNFSDLRKENSKPSSAASKTARPQLRNYNRSKSTSEDTPFVKEEKSRQLQSLRKSSANPVEFREISPLDTGSNSLTKFDNDETEENPYSQYSKASESKPFLKKGGGRDFEARTAVALQKATMAFDSANDEGEFDDLAFEAEDLVDLVKDEEEELETVTNKHHGEQELDLKSQKINFGSENGAMRSFAQVDSSLVAELPAAGFHSAENLQDSPGESPVSWNSRTQHPFSYSHEMSDIDASVDSPVGSPASWNSHPLNQTESDAARMRKKWGAAQKPMLVATSSHNQSRKDMSRGFKRLLKFGRKSRGTESLVDWISATTSEGDDDTEDGRDPANRSSEDLRKSRMGSLQGHPSDDSLIESEFFNEQVQSLRSSIPAPPANFKLREDNLSGSSIKAPRSFFSLSSFRSKGSESKPR